MNDAFETFSGIKIVSLVFAFIGAALGISYTPELTPRTAFAAMIAGIIFGAVGPELLVWGFGWHLPIIVNNVFALLFGIGGMFIVPGVIVAWKGFAVDPWGFVDRLRGSKKDGDKP